MRAGLTDDRWTTILPFLLASPRLYVGAQEAWRRFLDAVLWTLRTNQDLLKRCRFMARITALVYNWWSLFVRLANPDQHTEAVIQG